MSSLPLSERTYLLVEDEYFTASELMACLEEAGARVLGPVAHLDHALEVLSHIQAGDAAILDINLQGEMVYPFIDGLLERNIATVFVSGYEPDDIPQRYRALPSFQKPVDNVALIARLLAL
ncbi:response regulator [Shinella oryzae]|uniref:response regulator n=1 Tax=Shinella oryzae TaxID=2871820 RepID=UPI001FF4600E|nr:response regulator [Shinella oryzae]UPA26687.1 response regulator [Shinella oryzae]